METPVSTRKIAGFVGAAGIIWQLAVVALALRHAPILERTLRELGLALPNTTSVFLATYRWWAAVPVALAFWLVVAVRRATTAPRHAVAAALTALALGLILQSWLNEAVLAPLGTILEAVG